MKLIVAITGASGVNLGLKFLNLLPPSYEVFLVLSKSAKLALKYENGKDYKKLITKENTQVFKDNNIAAPIASGSFKTDKMVIIPCSMNTLAKCANGISDSLITRAFSVMIKEKREVLISPRELPFSSIALKNMHKLSKIGVTIAPPMLGYYSSQSTLEDMENFVVGKWFDLLGIDNNLYKRWE